MTVGIFRVVLAFQQSATHRLCGPRLNGGFELRKVNIRGEADIKAAVCLGRHDIVLDTGVENGQVHSGHVAKADARRVGQLQALPLPHFHQLGDERLLPNFFPAS
jgi:hypothetical protein